MQAMTKLLIVDPLDLLLEDEQGEVCWSTKSIFDACFCEEVGLVCEYTTARDPQLCKRVLAFDGVVLGGSEASAWEDTAFNDHLLDLIAICRHHEIPFLGICFGAQLLGRALGGHVAAHPEGVELGGKSIRISEKGKQHFLFAGFEGVSFRSVEAHSDAVLTLPPKCELLASTAHTPVQAFSYNGLLSGVQFHPEMNGDDLRCLWKAFQREGYVDTVTSECQQIIDTCDCPRLPQILTNFAVHISERKKAQVDAL